MRIHNKKLLFVFLLFFFCLACVLLKFVFSLTDLTQQSHDYDSWQAYNVPQILPPANTHPRLLITSEHLESIRNNLNSPQNQDAYSEFLSLTFSDENKLLSDFDKNDGGYDRMLLRAIEAKAFYYLLKSDKEFGKEAVSMMQHVLSFSSFPDEYSQRVQSSATLFTAAIVYDWCYDLMDSDARENYIELCEFIAQMSVMGWPPSEQEELTGYGAGTYLLRDLLSLGVAFYDERPEIYCYTAGRILEEYVPAHLEAYSSGLFHQGTAYGPERFYGDLFAEMIFSAFSDEYLYKDTLEPVAYGMIYVLRPDGQPFRMGDYYLEYDNSFPSLYAPAFLYLSTMLDDPILKEMYENCFDEYYYGEGLYSPVLHLIYNNPALEPAPADSLPLTAYFGGNQGVMIARTDWHFGETSASTAVLMKIGEIWGSNHDHLDAGTFQIFHKAALAPKSGVYDNYLSPHETGYNKRSIAQNSISIYSEDEPESNYSVSWYPDGINDGGQSWPANASEPSSLEEWTDGSFTRASTLGADFGPDSQTPSYSFLKGDITDSYWEGKADEIIRNMLFLPLNNSDGQSVFLVFDKVRSKNSYQKKSVLLHTLKEATVENSNIYVYGSDDTDAVEMQVSCLLPRDAQISKIGGENERFLVGTQNLTPQTEPGGANESGWGRIEISSPVNNVEEYFLQVFFISGEESETTPRHPIPVSLLESAEAAGAQFQGYTVLFIRQKESYNQSFSISLNLSSQQQQVAIAGLAAGEWDVDTGLKTFSVTVSTDNGVAWFSIPAGCPKLSLTPVSLASEF